MYIIFYIQYKIWFLLDYIFEIKYSTVIYLRSFIPPRDHRVLSVREGARLQSFPDRITFFGSLNQQYKQVGNAVPPLMAKALAESMKMTLKKVLR